MFKLPTIIILTATTLSIQIFLVNSRISPDKVSKTTPCPKRCKCDEDKVVECQNIKLTNLELPMLVNRIPNDTEVLHLGSNMLTDFSLSVLKALDNLQELDLQSNQLSRIPENADGHLSRNLRTINLDNNNITGLRRDDFVGYGGLNELWLSRNKITEIGEEDLRYLIHLRSLLVDSNNLQSISKNAFKYNNYLTFISLNYNKLTEIKPGLFNKLRHLEEVDFHKNEIESIPDLMVSRINGLHTVDLSNNRLSKLPEHAFANMTNYGIVDIILSHNELISLQSSNFQNSAAVYATLSSNPLHCDCIFLASFKRITADGYVTIDEPICSTPLPLRGLEVESVASQAVGCSLCSNGNKKNQTNQVNCKNGGKCVIPNPVRAKFKCECQPGYEGELCEHLGVEVLKKACQNNKCSEYEKCVPLGAIEYNCTCNKNNAYDNDPLGNNILKANENCSPSSTDVMSTSGKISSVVWIVIVVATVVVVVGIFVAVYVVLTRKKQQTLLIDDVDDDGL